MNCFLSGIKTLDLRKPGEQGNKYMEVAGMKSPDGEEVQEYSMILSYSYNFFMVTFSCLLR